MDFPMAGESISSTDSLGGLAPVRLSRESEYGLEGLRVLARQPRGTAMLLEEIAEAGQLPPHFLAQIFQKLRRHRVVVSHRGAVRGYSLARPADQITLREIFEAIEGPDLFERCVFWPGHCGDQHPCCLHTRWVMIRQNLKEMIDGTTLEEVAGDAFGGLGAAVSDPRQQAERSMEGSPTRRIAGKGA